jgi:hypothetical protein
MILRASLPSNAPLGNVSVSEVDGTGKVPER